jgi:hypothetical protein
MPEAFVDYFRRFKSSPVGRPSEEEGTREIVPRLLAQPTEDGHAQMVQTLSPGLELATQLFGILDARRRSDNYTEWMQVGWCLHTISASSLLPVWVDFSRNSPKFVEGECERLWEQMRDDGLGIGLLRMWARQDNPEQYCNIMTSCVQPMIEKCSGRHNDVARIVYALLKGKFVSATPNGRQWYRFNGSLWKEDHENLCLLDQLSTTVRKHFLQAVNNIASAAPLDDLQGSTSSRAGADPTR